MKKKDKENQDELSPNECREKVLSPILSHKKELDKRRKEREERIKKNYRASRRDLNNHCTI